MDMRADLESEEGQAHFAQAVDGLAARLNERFTGLTVAIVICLDEEGAFTAHAYEEGEDIAILADALEAAYRARHGVSCQVKLSPIQSEIEHLGEA